MTMNMAHIFSGSPKKLDNLLRRRILPARHLLEQMDIHPGNTLIDFGAGIGYFSIPALDLVGPTGQVIAIDQFQRMLQELRRRAGERPNLIIVHATDLDDYTADIVLLVTVLHEIDDPQAFLTSCFHRLRPGGRLFVIDWQKKRTLEGPPVRERIAKETLLAMTDRPHREHQIHDAFYFLEFW